MRYKSFINGRLPHSQRRRRKNGDRYRRINSKQLADDLRVGGLLYLQLIDLEEMDEILSTMRMITDRANGRSLRLLTNSQRIPRKTKRQFVVAMRKVHSDLIHEYYVKVLGMKLKAAAERIQGGRTDCPTEPCVERNQ